MQSLKGWRSSHWVGDRSFCGQHTKHRIIESVDWIQSHASERTEKSGTALERCCFHLHASIHMDLLSGLKVLPPIHAPCWCLIGSVRVPIHVRVGSSNIRSRVACQGCVAYPVCFWTFAWRNWWVQCPLHVMLLHLLGQGRGFLILLLLDLPSMARWQWKTDELKPPDLFAVPYQLRFFIGCGVGESELSACASINLYREHSLLLPQADI